MRAKRAEAGIHEFDADSFSASAFLSLKESLGIFENKSIIVVKYPKEKKEVWDIVFQNIKDMEFSDNGFIILEDNLSKEEAEEIKKHVKTFIDHTEKKFDTRENLFPLANAIGRRDKKSAWTLWCLAISKGISAEEIYNIILWQVKAMVLALRSASALEAGMKPYPFESAKKFAKNFKESEIENLYQNLVDLYHEKRRGGLDMELSLERFILSI